MEKFRESLRGTIRSSLGFSVRMTGRTNLEYKDALGTLQINCEDMATKGIYLYADSIPDRNGHPREQIVDNIRRAMAHIKWVVEVR
jgi:hypothetical protein